MANTPRKDLRDQFETALHSWRVIKPKPDDDPDDLAPPIKQELRGVLLNGYDRLLDFAQEMGQLLEKERAAGPIPPEGPKYTLNPTLRQNQKERLSNRVQIRTDAVREGILVDIGDNPQVQACDKPDDAKEALLGSLIRRAAKASQRLGYLPDTFLINGMLYDRNRPVIDSDYIRQLRDDKAGFEL